MTVRVDPKELLKIEERTIFFRIQFQGQWSQRLYPNPTAVITMPIREGGHKLEADAYKFDGEKRVHFGHAERRYLFGVNTGGEIEITLTVKSTEEI